MILHGINLIDAERIARILGCEVASRHRTGERRMSHPSMPKSVVYNHRRKDAPRSLIAWLRRVEMATALR